jgi:FkbM family methyltransferase
LIWRLPITQHRVVVVQLGAFIGATRNDPLYRFLKHYQSGPSGHGPEITAILVEPVSDFCERLKQNYDGCRNIVFENAAISAKAGRAAFYRLKPGLDLKRLGRPEWLYQIGSLHPERITTLWEGYERDPALQRFLRENLVVEEVPCLTFAQLAEKHHLDEIDLLQIDVEGHELEILQTIDFTRHRIRALNYERVLLGKKEATCRALLRENGFELWDHGQDTLAIRPELVPSLGWGHRVIRAWLTLIRTLRLSRQPLPEN